MVGASLMLMVAILYSAAQLELVMSFSTLEESLVNKDVDRALNAISSDVTSLDDLADYWSGRNDTYDFIDTGDRAFINYSLDSDALSNLRINLVIFMDSYGQSTFCRYQERSGNISEAPEDLQTILSFYGICPGCLDKLSSHSGIISLSGRPMLISIHPINRIGKGGRSVGRMVVGRYLTQDEISRLSEITRLNLTICTLNDGNMPDDFRKARSVLSIDKPVAVQLLDGDTIAGYALLSNVYGTPLLILRVDETRSVYNIGMASLRTFLILFTLAGIIFLITTLLYLDRSVLLRLSALTTGVAGIGRNQNMAGRLAVIGKDELSGLASSINTMLCALEEAHENLMRSERRYKAIVEDQSDLILRNLADGTITFANGAFCSFFSKGRGEITGLNVDQVISDEYLGPVIELIKRLRADSPTATYESMFIISGERRWISWTIGGIFDDRGAMIEIQSVGRDITDIKVANESLIQSERQLSDIIDFLPDAILAIDLEGNVIAWNKAMEALTGVRAGEILGRGNYEYSVPFYRYRRPILVDMVLRPGKNYEAEYINFQKEGSAVIGEVFLPGLGPNGSYLLAKAAPLYTVSGAMIGAIESIRDMTERRLMEQKLERTSLELDIAADIQKSFIPERTPDVPGFDMAAVTTPAMIVGGDFYDFLPMPDGRYGLVIADVAGKSISAALFMALSRTIIRATASGQSSITDVLKNASRMISHDATSGMFVTLLYGVLDGDGLSFSYANAGHPPPLILRGESCQVVEEGAGGIALGIVEDPKYAERVIRFSPGDLAVFYTDGVTDAMNSEGEMYGLGRLEEVVKRCCRRDAKEIIRVIQEDISDFCAGKEQHDDITLIVLRTWDAKKAGTGMSIGAREENVPALIEWAGELMKERGFGKEEILEMQIAVEEACVNIIRHGYGGAGGVIEASLDVVSGGIGIALEDRAFEFNPLTIGVPDLTQSLDKRKVGGLGIHLIRSLTDDLRYERRDGKNRLILMKMIDIEKSDLQDSDEIR